MRAGWIDAMELCIGALHTVGAFVPLYLNSPTFCLYCFFLISYQRKYIVSWAVYSCLFGVDGEWHGELSQFTSLATLNRVSLDVGKKKP